MKNLGYIMWVGAGIVLWFFMMSSLYEWWNMGGAIAGIILAPGVVLFPLLYWFMEGIFPVTYFIIWAVGMAGIFISSASSKK